MLHARARARGKRQPMISITANSVAIHDDPRRTFMRHYNLDHPMRFTSSIRVYFRLGPRQVTRLTVGRDAGGARE